MLPSPLPRRSYQLGLLDSAAEKKVRILAIPLQISLQVLANLPSSRQLRSVVVPGQVAEVHGVPTLVCDHQGMDQAGPVILPGGP